MSRLRIALSSCWVLVALSWVASCGEPEPPDEPEPPECAVDRADEILVSGYLSNQVHRFDVCGAPLGQVETEGRIRGAQATRLGADGLLYVISEENGRILRYQASTLEYVDTLIDLGLQPDALGGIERPTGLAIGPEGDLFVGGYESRLVARIDDTGALVDSYDLAPSGVAGIDAGMAFHPDGRLLVPGYDSNSIAALDVETGDMSEFAGAGAGLSRPRVIAVDEDRARILVSSQGANRVQILSYQGESQGLVISLSDVTGLALDVDGQLLVTSDSGDALRRYDAEGALLGALNQAGTGGLRGATFITVLPR